MATIQDFFIGEPERIDISPGEYTGPLTIKHSCTIDGHGATLWTKKGAALIVDAPNVTIKNLRVELITQTKEFIAVDVRHKNVQLENVEVYGNIRGLDSASEDWNLPRTIDFGNFAAGERNEFSSCFKVNESCRVINSVYGLNIEPQSLSPGEVDLRLTIEPMKDGMIIYGSFLLETSNKILRRVYVSGRARKGATIHVAPKKFFPASNPQQKNSSRSDSASKIKRGQRIFAPNVEKISVAFKANDLPPNMTIDACAFCLGKDKKVQRDTDLIFFNNPRHDSLGVSLDSNGNTSGISLSLKDLPNEIQSVVICFSIYDEGNRSDDFSSLTSPKVIICADISYEFPLNLGREKIFTALEFYRDKDAWKIHFIGLGLKNNFKQLCESYGVEVL